MKGRKQRTRRARRHFEERDSTQFFDTVPEGTGVAVESVLLSPNVLNNAINKSAMRRATVGGIPVYLDLATGDEIVTLAEKLHAQERSTNVDQKTDLVEYFGASLKENRVFVARNKDGVVIAAAIYSPSALSRHQDAGTVISGYIFVDEQFRGRGVGREFCSLCCQFAERYGFQLVLAEVSPTNAYAMKMVQASGFQILGGFPEIAEAGNQGEKLLVMKMLEQNYVMKMSRL